VDGQVASDVRNPHPLALQTPADGGVHVSEVH